MPMLIHLIGRSSRLPKSWLHVQFDLLSFRLRELRSLSMKGCTKDVSYGPTLLYPLFQGSGSCFSHPTSFCATEPLALPK